MAGPGVLHRAAVLASLAAGLGVAWAGTGHWPALGWLLLGYGAGGWASQADWRAAARRP